MMRDGKDMVDVDIDGKSYFNVDGVFRFVFKSV